MKNSNTDMNITTWNTLISAYSVRGDWKTSLQLFNSLKPYNLMPNAVTFTFLLTAASHSGEVDAALEIYNLMNSVHGVIPDNIHATIVVDALSRSGKLQEAVEFIQMNIPQPSILILIIYFLSWRFECVTTMKHTEN